MAGADMPFGRAGAEGGLECAAPGGEQHRPRAVRVGHDRPLEPCRGRQGGDEVLGEQCGQVAKQHRDRRAGASGVVLERKALSRLGRTGRSRCGRDADSDGGVEAQPWVGHHCGSQPLREHGGVRVGRHDVDAATRHTGTGCRQAVPGDRAGEAGA